MPRGDAERAAGLFRPDRQHRFKGAEPVDFAGDPHHRTGDRIAGGRHHSGKTVDQADPEGSSLTRHRRQDGGVRDTLIASRSRKCEWFAIGLRRIARASVSQMLWPPVAGWGFDAGIFVASKMTPI